MGLFEIFTISLGIAMSAFSICIYKGLSIKDVKLNYILKYGLYFGIVKVVLVLLGYILSYLFKGYLIGEENIVTFILLLIIGSNMIKKSKEDMDHYDNDSSDKTLLLIILISSIDTIAAGVSFAMFNTNIITMILMVFVVTMILSMIGIKFSTRMKDVKVEFIGGIILIIIGIEYLLKSFILF